MAHLNLLYVSILGLWLYFSQIAVCNPNKAHQQNLQARHGNETHLVPKFFINKGSKRVKLKYGPFTVPPMHVNGGLLGISQPDAQIGCKNCLVTYMEAGLEYADGSPANANSSLLLYQTALSNLNKSDSVCTAKVKGERFFGAGNEKTPMNICVNGTVQAGYLIKPNDHISFESILINAAMWEQNASVTITYEYIPIYSNLPLPTEFKKATPVWLDDLSCASNLDDANFDFHDTYSSNGWTSTIAGQVTFGIGHIGEGGTNLLIRKNNATMFNTTALYGENSAFVDGPNTDPPGGLHLSSISTYTGGEIRQGDQLSVMGYYKQPVPGAMVVDGVIVRTIMGMAVFYLM